MPVLNIGRFGLHYEVNGHGEALVLAHGAGGNNLSWWQQVPRLSRHFTVITFDHRGFGRSPDETNGPGAHAFVTDLAALLDHLGIRRVAVLGQSMGGWTALGFASAYPDRTLALILCDTTAGIETALTAPVHARLHALARGTMTNLLRTAYAASFPEREPALAFLYHQISALNTDIPPTLIADLLEIHHDVAPIAHHAVPTLLLVGEEDVTVPPHAMASLARQIPHAVFIRVSDAGHSVYFESAQAFNGAIEGFLSKVIFTGPLAGSASQGDLFPSKPRATPP